MFISGQKFISGSKNLNVNLSILVNTINKEHVKRQHRSEKKI